MNAPQSTEPTPKRGLRRVPVGIWLLIALAVIVGAGFLLFSLASAAGTGSTGPTTSTVVLGALLG